MDRSIAHSSRFLHFLKDPSVWLFLAGLSLLIWHSNLQPQDKQSVKADLIFHYNLNMYFDVGENDVSVRTYLPANNDRQQIIKEAIHSDTLRLDTDDIVSGRQAVWKGNSNKPIRYNALLSLQEERYEIDPEIQIASSYPSSIAKWLKATKAMPTDHPEIKALWQTIKPEEQARFLSTARSIFDYVHLQIEGAPFKGFTDALTALRLQQASCNGKGRLFASLARQNGIPARLIGGVILNDGQKRTSHQWIELYLQGYWIPFDPTNGHFAYIPKNYLQLYVGDKVLFGHTRDINFDYQFSIRSEHLALPLLQNEQKYALFPNAAEMLSRLGIDYRTAGIFLLFPLVALIISFARNVIGLKTFGIFMPMLISAACVYTGFWTGIVGFVAVLLIAYAGQVFFERHKLLKVPRLAAVITLNTIFFIMVLKLMGDKNTLELGMITLFPVVIISFIAERLNHLSQDGKWSELLKLSLGTLFVITVCYLIFSSIMLQGFFAVYPESLLLVLALQVIIGKWTGMRISEYFRFRKINQHGNTVNINQRNRDYVYTLNERPWLELAIDKIASKQALMQQGIPVPQTLLKCESFLDLDRFLQNLEHFDSFVIKPNRGSQGNGIIVIESKDEKYFYSPSRKAYSRKDIRHHLSEIISGSFSQDGQSDIAYLEPLLVEHRSIAQFANLGLSDIRLIVCKQSIISCMLRIPTALSEGKANLHQGAIGLSVNIDTGITEVASFKGETLTHHPDSGVELAGKRIPFWDQICSIALQAQQAVPLGYIGVDVCIDQKLGPLVLEVNGRPGLEIQNVQQKGFSNELKLAIDTI